MVVGPFSVTLGRCPTTVFLEYHGVAVGSHLEKCQELAGDFIDAAGGWMCEIGDQIIAVPDRAIGAPILPIDPEIRYPAQIWSDRIGSAETQSRITVNLSLNHPFNAETGLIGVRFRVRAGHVV